MVSGSKHFAVIGAGLAGAVFAQEIMAKGHQVTVFEKSRGTGGRMASSRLQSASVDLGNPWLSAQGKEFAQWLEQQSVLVPWSPIVADFSDLTTVTQTDTVFVAKERQSALTRALLNGAQLNTSTRVGFVWQEDDGVIVRDEKGAAIGTYDFAVIATPAPQAAPLLEAVQRYATRAEKVATSATWVTALSLKGCSVTEVGVIHGVHPMFKRCIQSSAKPHRGDQQVWVLEATDAWSLAHLELTPAEVLPLMTEQFLELLGTLGAMPTVIESKAHRWLYANHQSELDQPYLYSSAEKICACGDWLATPGAEGAWISAKGLAAKVLADLA